MELKALYYVVVSEAVEMRKIWTEAELKALREDGFIHEVVDGELVMSPNRGTPARIQLPDRRPV